MNPYNNSEISNKNIKREIVNNLNELTAKDWMINTKSVWVSSDYHFNAQDSPNIRYIRNLILFFTKSHDLILNPTNDTIIEKIAFEENRNVVFETYSKVDFILLSENNKFNDFTEYKSRIQNELLSKYTNYFNLLKEEKYLCVKIKDFHIIKNHGYSELILFHCDFTNALSSIGFRLKAITIWVPEKVKLKKNKTENPVTHEYLLIYRKEDKTATFKGNKIVSYLRSPEFIEDKEFYPSFRISVSPPRDKYKTQHPATFPEPDIESLISFYNNVKENPKILDPFSGVGSTLLAALELGVESWGIELTRKWVKLTKERFHHYNPPSPIKINRKIFQPKNLTSFFDSFETEEKKPIQTVLVGDSRERLKEFDNDFFDFVVTSPPYWGILTKKIDHKTRRERVNKGLKTTYTEEEDQTFIRDLGNITSYKDFFKELELIYRLCFDKLRNNGYMVVIVSDFRDKSDFHLYHCMNANVLRKIGFKLINISILYQDNKNLYPYGYPFVFVSNIHHQYIIIVKKERDR